MLFSQWKLSVNTKCQRFYVPCNKLLDGPSSWVAYYDKRMILSSEKGQLLIDDWTWRGSSAGVRASISLSLSSISSLSVLFFILLPSFLKKNKGFIIIIVTMCSPADDSKTLKCRHQWDSNNPTYRIWQRRVRPEHWEISADAPHTARPTPAGSVCRWPGFARNA